MKDGKLKSHLHPEGEFSLTVLVEILMMMMKQLENFVCLPGTIRAVQYLQQQQ